MRSILSFFYGKGLAGSQNNSQTITKLVTSKRKLRKSKAKGIGIKQKDRNAAVTKRNKSKAKGICTKLVDRNAKVPSLYSTTYFPSCSFRVVSWLLFFTVLTICFSLKPLTRRCSILQSGSPAVVSFWSNVHTIYFPSRPFGILTTVCRCSMRHSRIPTPLKWK